VKALLVGLFFFVFAGEDQTSVIKNARVTDEGILTSGQPTRAQLTLLKAAGYTAIINLRPYGEVQTALEATQDSNFNFDEEDAAKKVGIKYFSLPVASAEDLTVENVRVLDQLLQSLNNEKVVLHCSSGNRVGALLALRAFHVQGKPRDEALALGRAAGLTRLEPVVKKLLSVSK